MKLLLYMKPPQTPEWHALVAYRNLFTISSVPIRAVFVAKMRTQNYHQKASEELLDDTSGNS